MALEPRETSLHEFTIENFYPYFEVLHLLTAIITQVSKPERECAVLLVLFAGVGSGTRGQALRSRALPYLVHGLLNIRTTLGKGTDLRDRQEHACRIVAQLRGGGPLAASRSALPNTGSAERPPEYFSMECGAIS